MKQKSIHKIFILLSSVICAPFLTSAQHHDTTTIRLLNVHSMEMLQSGFADSAKYLNDSALALSSRIADSNGYIHSQFYRSTLLLQELKYNEAKEVLLKVQHWFRRNGKEKMYITTNVRLATLASIQEDYSEGLKLYYEILPDIERTKDTSLLISSLNNIATTYFLQNIYDDALQFYQRSLQLAEKKDAKAEIAKNNSDIGGVYFKQAKYTDAAKHCNIALDIYTHIKDDWGIAYANSVLGNIYEKDAETLKTNHKKEWKEKSLQALSSYQNMLAISIAINDIDGISEANLYIGNLYILLNQSDSARYYLQRCLQQASAIGKKQYIRDAYNGLYRLDTTAKQYQNAVKHFEKFVIYRDSIVNEESLRKSDQYKAKYEITIKEDEIRLLSAENKLKTALAEKENQRKNFALAGIAIIGLVGGYGFYRFRKKKKLQNEQNLMNERLRISRELHDEVGATLSGVSMYSHLTKTQLQSQDFAGVENSLNIMQDSSAQMVNKLNDIVWLINPDKSSLPDLMQKLEEYARKMAAAKNMEVKTDIAENIHQHQLTMEQRRNIYLFCKEAINNAVKYSNGALLQLEVVQEKDIIAFSVIDNGKGFDTATVRKGNGLNNMKQRADDIGAKLSLQSTEEKGTIISIRLKIT